MKLVLRFFCIFSLVVWFSGFSSCSYFSSSTSLGSKTNVVSQPRIPALTDSDLENKSKDELVLILRGLARESDNASAIVDLRKSLSFRVKNLTPKLIFVTCFYWMKNKPEGPWRWDKTKIYSLNPNEMKFVVLDEIEDERDRKDVYGYLAVFANEEDANKAVIERTEEDKLLALNKVYDLKNKIVSIEIKKYGLIGESLSYQSVATNSGHQESKILNLIVENQSGKDLLICLFVYEQPEKTFSFDTWRYDKTEVQLFRAGEVKRINLPPVFDEYRYSYIRGVLGVFDLKDKVIAENTTFELAPAENKLALGVLSVLKGKKIVVGVEKYGIFNNFIDYTIKPAAFLNKKTGQWVNIKARG